MLIGASVLLLLVWPMLSSFAGELVQADTVRTGVPGGQMAADTTAHGEMLLMADSLAAQYAGGGKGRQSDQTGASGRPTGQLIYERTLVPLHHAGGNVYRSVLDEPSLLAAIRRLKGSPEWDPFQPGQSEGRPYDYHYNRDGTTTASHIVRASVERVLTSSRPAAYLLTAKYAELWGPFPNQHTTRLDGLVRLSYRVSPTQIATVRLLGSDNGWYLRRGNTVYTDRARYALEDLNRWRARTGGVELVLSDQPTASFSSVGHVRVLSTAWASDPPDAPTPLPATVPMEPPFIDGVFPATIAPRFSAHRSAFTLSFGADMTLQADAVHRITAGIEARLHHLRHSQQWVPSPDPREADRFDLQISPREYTISFEDRLRFGALVMAIGIRYDAYSPGGALWRDVYRTLGDDRVAQDAVRHLLLTAGGDSQGAHLINPYFVTSYPFGRFNAHLTFSISSRSPSFEQLYAGSDIQTSPYTDRLKTDLRPQRLTMLEGGIGRSLGAYTVDVTAFYRDSERFLPVFGPEVLPQALSNYPGYWGRINAGFHGQRGAEVAIIRRATPVGTARVRLAGRLSYLYLHDLGPLHDTDFSLQPHQPMTPGDFTTFGRWLNDLWSRRHWVAVVASVRLRSGLSLTATGHVQSGVRYRTPDPGRVGQSILPDRVDRTGIGPWVRRADARVDLPLPRILSLPAATLFVEVRNVMNTRIIDEIPDPRSFEMTGQPDNPVLNQAQWVYGPARTIWSGIGFQW